MMRIRYSIGGSLRRFAYATDNGSMPYLGRSQLTVTLRSILWDGRWKMLSYWISVYAAMLSYARMVHRYIFGPNCSPVSAGDSPVIEDVVVQKEDILSRCYSGLQTN